jgi:hypothetical protein
MSPALLISLTVSALVPHALEFLKAAPWFPFVQPHARRLNRIMAVLVAIATSIGVSWSFNQEAGTLTITGLRLTEILPLAAQAVANFVTQEVVYRTAIRAPKP